MVNMQRPLSPHLQIYRWQITMLLSSLHRITGLLLSIGAVALAAWLIAIASGAQAYQDLERLLAGTWFKVLVVGWTFSFFFHLFNGIRHLVWDAGYGFERSQARASGWTVLIACVGATAAFAWTVLP
jgi:succinate dehydrogenase / fumarate reductase, cytochrome b subunit